MMEVFGRDLCVLLHLIRWDTLENFPWGWFAALAFIYTAIVFSGELSKDGPLIFSRKNKRTSREVLVAHLSFLAILLALYRIAVALDPRIPNWMANFAGRGGTWYEILFMGIAVVVGLVERRWLFVQSGDRSRESLTLD